MMTKKLKAPFPYFGGKSRVAAEVWKRFGDVKNYVEPFCGSAAMLLARPLSIQDAHQRIETINDADGMVSNFWRAMTKAPDEVIHHADWPVNEADLHARHLWLVRKRADLTSKLMADPDYFDAKAAGWWVWGFGAWIGQGWCSGKGPWTEVDGEFVRAECELGVARQIPHISDKGNGVHRPTRDPKGRAHAALSPLADRLKHVRVACGDWQRVCNSRTTTIRFGTVGVFIDPPYSHGNVDYAIGGRDFRPEIIEWALKWGKEESMRVAICGYDEDFSPLEEQGWEIQSWKANGGYGSQAHGQGRKNSKRERIWFSPHCLNKE